ncbi:MAG: hypothetical protein ABIX01_17420 [Chitinophagaceae bacterium]
MKNVLIVIAAAMMFVGCKTTAKGKNGVVYNSAVEYNDYIVTKQTDLVKQIIRFSKEAQDGDLTAAGRTVDDAVSFSDKAITDIEGMPEWKGNTTMRDNAVNLFKFYKEIFARDYRRILEMKGDNQLTPEEESEYNKMMANITSKEGDLDKEFKASQQSFAKDNNMKVLENDMQKKIDEMK